MVDVAASERRRRREQLDVAPGDRVLQLVEQLDELDDAELLDVHREVSRRAAAVYAARHPERYAAGVNAARERWSAGDVRPAGHR